jgi:2',3'-cyclic-nucleotide 2'-phosphodiesterase (5'-nucleotidase family)
MDDGDSAHWVPTKSKAKKISTPVAESGRTAKYVGKSKVSRKKISGK